MFHIRLMAGMLALGAIVQVAPTLGHQFLDYQIIYLEFIAMA